MTDDDEITKNHTLQATMAVIRRDLGAVTESISEIKNELRAMRLEFSRKPEMNDQQIQKLRLEFERTQAVTNARLEILEKNSVPVNEFRLTQKLVYGASGLILTAVIMGMIAVVISSP